MPASHPSKPKSYPPSIWKYQATLEDLADFEGQIPTDYADAHFNKESKYWYYHQSELESLKDSESQQPIFSKTNTEFYRGAAAVAEKFPPSDEEMKKWFFDQFKPPLLLDRNNKEHEKFCHLFLARFCIDGFLRSVTTLIVNAHSRVGIFVQENRQDSVSNIPSIELISVEPTKLKFKIKEQYNYTQISSGQNDHISSLLNHPICTIKHSYEIILTKQGENYFIQRKHKELLIEAYSGLADLVFPGRNLNAYLINKNNKPIIASEFVNMIEAEDLNINYEQCAKYYENPPKKEYFEQEMKTEKDQLAHFQKEMKNRKILIEKINQHIQWLEKLSYRDDLIEYEIKFLHQMLDLIKQNTKDSLDSAKTQLCEMYFNKELNPYYSLRNIKVKQEEIIASLTTSLSAYVEMMTAFDEKMRNPQEQEIKIKPENSVEEQKEKTTTWGDWFKGLWQKLRNLLTACFAFLTVNKSAEGTSLQVQDEASSIPIVLDFPVRDNGNSFYKDSKIMEDLNTNRAIRYIKKHYIALSKEEKGKLDKVLNQLNILEDAKLEFSFESGDQSAQEFKKHLRILKIDFTIDSSNIIIQGTENCQKYKKFKSEWEVTEIDIKDAIRGIQKHYFQHYNAFSYKEKKKLNKVLKQDNIAKDAELKFSFKFGDDRSAEEFMKFMKHLDILAIDFEEEKNSKSSELVITIRGEKNCKRYKHFLAIPHDSILVVSPAFFNAKVQENAKKELIYHYRENGLFKEEGESKGEKMIIEEIPTLNNSL